MKWMDAWSLVHELGGRVRVAGVKKRVRPASGVKERVRPALGVKERVRPASGVKKRVRPAVEGRKGDASFGSWEDEASCRS
jgi:hypothetical protein